MDFAAYYDESQMLFGQISELYSAPVIPKMIIVGLTTERDENLRLFKEILTKALDNLFVIEFCEQFIPETVKLSSNQVHYRNHEVKETWMYKMRQERPAILIDFRLISDYIFNEDDSILSEQLLQTKCSLPEDGPVYLVWLAGKGISTQKIGSISKQAKMDKSTISVIELWNDATMITTSLKQRIQECFEHSRLFYQNLGKRYKKSLGLKNEKFVQPWMPIVYYYFKLAVLEEFRGDFQSALKYYHTILAKFKELIEASRDERYQMINYLRKFADICFIRLSFLLFRLNQCGEAEFGLFRYFNYFSQGLNINDQLMWRYNMSRGFARQLIKSSIWLKENDLLMRGPAHFLIYALKMIKKYTGEEVYQVQEMKMRDLSDALESAIKNPQLSHFVDYLQFLIIEQYFSQSLYEESGAFISYLKGSEGIKSWKLLENEILNKSISLAKSQQNYQISVIDTWRRCKDGANSSHMNTANSNYDVDSTNDFSLIEDWCLMYAQIFHEPIRFNFSSNDFINCNVKFSKRRCEIFEECEVELNVYTSKRSPIEFQVESIGIFFDNEQLEPVTFTSDSGNFYFKPGEILNLKGKFNPSKVGKLKISFVTMQLKKPFLALQFDDAAFFHQQNSEIFCNESLTFVRLCQKTLKNNLSLRVEALKPKIKVEIMVKEGVTLGFTEIPISVTISNQLDQATITEFNFESEKYEINLGPNESQILSLRQKITTQNRVHIKTKTRFNLELMDFKFTEICNFDVIEEDFYSNFIELINPFKISLKKNNQVAIKAHCPIEWLSLTGTVDPFIMEKGEKRTFTINSNMVMFMKRKDEAEERKQVEKETQKSVERTHWTLEEKLPSTSGTGNKLKFIVEYDNTGGISGPSVVRQSFKNFNKEAESVESAKSINASTTASTKAGSGPMNKIPKLSENKKKN